jgi:uncharacterized lipoprotein
MNLALTRTVSRTGLIACALLLGSCSLFHRGSKHGCREPDVARSAVNLPPLKVPAGLDAPDTRNAIQVPPLATPAQPRSANDPCLSAPPTFKGPG